MATPLTPPERGEIPPPPRTLPVRELFRRWALPGEKPDEETSLRLALRNGYLNFYIKGQSVAKLSLNSKGPKLEIAKVYVDGHQKGSEGDRSVGYQTFDAKALSHPETVERVSGWIATAETYASAEKCFVDDVVSANPGVIDLEMGLPAHDVPGSKRVAPRMDLVLVQMDDGRPSLGFWEAKCANNSALRASGDGEPDVTEQLRNYVHWMNTTGRVKEVQTAYRVAASLLTDLFTFYGGGRDLPCLRIWEALATSDPLPVVAQPGLVIGNYHPGLAIEPDTPDPISKSARSFGPNGHLEKLQHAGIPVQEFGRDDDMILPVLSDLAQAAEARRSGSKSVLPHRRMLPSASAVASSKCSRVTCSRR